MKEQFYNGAQGNLSLFISTAELAALAASGSVTLAQGLPVGTEITGVRYVSDALGANTALKVDVVDSKSVSTTLLASTASTSALSAFKPIVPVYISDNGPSNLVLTNSGTGAATGGVTIQLEYRFKGY